MISLLTTLLFSTSASALLMPAKPESPPAPPSLLEEVVYRGEKVAPEGESWKFTVHFSTDHGVCTGSFIQPNVILTAAHCKVGTIITEVSMVFFRGAEPAFTKTIEKPNFVMLANPRFDFDSDSEDHDIGLIVFKDDILPEGYETVELLPSEQNRALRKGDAVTLIGAGMPAEGVDKEAGNPLKFTTATIDALKKHSVALTGSFGSGTCDGDSGGPALVRGEDSYFVVGVNSATQVADLEKSCGSKIFLARLADSDREWMDSAIEKANAKLRK